MGPTRNQQQLILVKQLYEDARLFEERGDAFSLTKAVVLLDLSIENILNNIILNLDRSRASVDGYSPVSKDRELYAYLCVRGWTHAEQIKCY